MVEQVEAHAAHDGPRVARDHRPRRREVRLHVALVDIPHDAVRPREHLVGDVVVQLESHRAPVGGAPRHPGCDRSRESRGERQRAPEPRAALGAVPSQRERQESARQERDAVVARQERQAGEHARERDASSRGGRSAGAEQCPQRGRLQRQRGRVGRDRPAVAKELGVAREEHQRDQCERRVRSTHEDRTPQDERRGHRGDRQQLGGVEQIVDDESESREHELEHRADDRVARRVQVALQKGARPRAVRAIEVGLGEHVADRVRTQRHGQRGGGVGGDHGPARPAEPWPIRWRTGVERECWTARDGRGGDGASGAAHARISRTGLECMGDDCSQHRALALRGARGPEKTQRRSRRGLRRRRTGWRGRETRSPDPRVTPVGSRRHLRDVCGTGGDRWRGAVASRMTSSRSPDRPLAGVERLRTSWRDDPWSPVLPAAVPTTSGRRGETTTGVVESLQYAGHSGIASQTCCGTE